MLSCTSCFLYRCVNALASMSFLYNILDSVSGVISVLLVLQSSLAVNLSTGTSDLVHVENTTFPVQLFFENKTLR